jgi:hypothetical protein
MCLFSVLIADNKHKEGPAQCRQKISVLTQVLQTGDPDAAGALMKGKGKVAGNTFQRVVGEKLQRKQQQAEKERCGKETRFHGTLLSAHPCSGAAGL